VTLKAGIFTVIASVVLCGCATGQAERDADNIRSLPRPRIGASNGGGEPATTREEYVARQKELERERWMNPLAAALKRLRTDQRLRRRLAGVIAAIDAIQAAPYLEGAAICGCPGGSDRCVVVEVHDLDHGRGAFVGA
jgi:hypothetical protein